MKKALEIVAENIKWMASFVLLVLGTLPLYVQSSYALRILTISLMYVMIALSLNLLTGFCGLMTLGHAAFWGIGAYVAAILSTRIGLGMGLSMVASGLFAGGVACILGLTVLKLKGYYLTVVTLGFCEIVRLIEMNWMAVTRGPLGIARIPAPNLFGIDLSSNTAIYYIILILAVLTALVVFRIVHSRIGLSIMACRDDDLAAASIGINVYRCRVMVFVISAVIVGIAGAFYAHYISFIDPSSFTTAASIDMLVMAIFGGLGSIPGTIIGAFVLTVLPETMRALAEYRTLIYGVLIVILMMVKPDGLLGNVNFKYIRQQLEQEREQEPALPGKKDGR